MTPMNSSKGKSNGLGSGRSSWVEDANRDPWAPSEALPLQNGERRPRGRFPGKGIERRQRATRA